jgi:methyl-accepting chemotaxis protein
VLQDNEDYMGVWVGFEPDALDGEDDIYRNKSGHDQTGRYLPYWTRVNGKIKYQTIKNYTEPGKGDFYLIPLGSARENVSDPSVYMVDGKEIGLVSLTAPVLFKGRAIGVVGVDLSVEQCRDVINRNKPYGTGYKAIISNSGMIVAHPNKELVGKNLFDLGYTANYLAEIKKGKRFAVTHESEITGEISYLYFSPIKLGDNNKPWSVVVCAPRSAVLAGAQKARDMGMLIGLIALLAVSCGVYLVARGIAGPLQKSTEDLRLSAESVSSASEQIASSSQQLSSGATEQASALEETSAALEEIASMTKQNAEHAEEADEYMKDVGVVVEEAVSSMQELIATVSRINQTSSKTAGIIKTVEKIAFQTNLLALNAAVEAARAGEAGSGFAVVADEVRNLALRSAKAAKDTAVLIKENQDNLKAGSDVLGRTNKAFGRVNLGAEKVAGLVNEIAAASREQSQGIDQVTKAAVNMDQVTQQVAANAEESAAAAEELSGQALGMREQVLRLNQLTKGTKTEYAKNTTRLGLDWSSKIKHLKSVERNQINHAG